MKKIFISLFLALISAVGAWAQDYLTMKAVGGSVSIGMEKNGTPANYDLQYSLDRTHWTLVALTATNSNIVEIPAGQTCYFRHGTETEIGRISSNADNYWTFTMTGTGTIEAGGNIMSLLDATVQRNTIGSFAFTNLFKGCGKLTKAPRLPATSISERCYMGMFEETGITEAPALPAASVIKGSYQNMFKNCLNLEKAPKLLATRVNWVGYQEMFYGCKKIKEVTIGEITDIENGNAFTRWLEGTANGTNGVLLVPESMKSKSFSLPSNWRMMTRSEYIAENEPTAVSFTFEGDGMPIETQHYLEDLKMAFSEDGEEMTVRVNGAFVTYNLNNVGELVHFRGTPRVSLHANEDPTDGQEGNFYTSFYSGLEAYALPEGVKAYTAEVDGEDIVLTRIEGPLTSSGQVILPQGEAVLLYSNTLTNGNWTMTVADPSSASPSNTNQFCGVDVATEQEAANYYMLSYGQFNLGFYKMNSSMMLSANKAFIAQSPSAPARALRMVFAEDEEMSIESIGDDSESSPSEIYSLSGVRQTKLQQGINIVNGKKIVVK